METKSFVKLLRKVIREEVSTALRNILAEQKVDHNKVMSHGMDLHKIVEHPSPYSTKKKKTYTKDNMLNDLLNETAATGDFASMMQSTDYPTMGGMKTSAMAETFGMSRQPQALATTTSDGRPVDMNNENVAKTVNLMTKDYSALMKAIDKKRGIK